MTCEMISFDEEIQNKTVKLLSSHKNTHSELRIKIVKITVKIRLSFASSNFFPMSFEGFGAL